MNSVPAKRHPFAATDLMGLARLQDPQLSPDGKRVVYTLRENDLDANRISTSLWWLDLDVADARPRRLTPAQGNDSNARWAPEGRRLFFLSRRSGSSQVWMLPIDFGEAQAVTALPLDVTSFRLSPNGQHLVVSMDVFPDGLCPRRAISGTCAH
jgi:dipeptidyl aminopeptidase/acylaminoacyl peptidase